MQSGQGQILVLQLNLDWLDCNSRVRWEQQSSLGTGSHVPLCLIGRTCFQDKYMLSMLCVNALLSRPAVGPYTAQSHRRRSAGGEEAVRTCPA